LTWKFAQVKLISPDRDVVAKARALVTGGSVAVKDCFRVMNITRRFRSYFLRGLAVLLPTMLTMWILAWGYGLIQRNVSVHINRGLVKAQTWVWVQRHEGISDDAVKKYEENLNERFAKGFAGSIVGLLIAMVAIVLVGALLASVMGRALWGIIEASIMNTPVLRRVYPYVKQVTDFVLTAEDQQRVFSKVVAVEYPRKGLWSVGFVTGSGLRKISRSEHQELLTVLISTCPTPITGPVIIVPKEETIALDMTIEEAVRFVVSAGVIAPDDRRPVALPAGPIEQEKC